ncbi:mannose-6-phosphate isomerase [Agrilactobacillus composti DSM 18527 = JCM 14202]|uniref:Mannose-6-phosphate isomerase n=1 Tax=Agrilactobacillus composti DSM 18527 = JCM 14202 TaxID=1423734 RepID=X0PEE1_9LACO|nr:mannose-6-phosphate isomerase, class I [Agrilactobacillus composti]KRM30799.1 mannose-6-phosphate isomerase [Agrilactobacillus composti DSM 18527 = JCM 14202]GAF39793.1 mannose-6-phosphate isomerase [Agrilactobacillus composti DSM 18527 = JCM 14202]
MNEVLLLKPVFHEKIWGGQKLAQFGYKLPATDIGECWAISGHPHGTNTIENGDYAGQTLAQLWQDHRELFDNMPGDRFPLLTKILDAEASLSVQVHPGDAYAKEHAHDLGKTECWYIIDADPGAYLIYGHHAKTKAEFEDLVHAGQWDKLLRKQPVKTGDFVYVPSGTVHALNKGIMALETQQSSDTTYRLYDYDRIDKTTGEKRELHLKDAFNVTQIPFEPVAANTTSKTVGASTLTTLVSAPVSKYFNVYRWVIKDEVAFKKAFPCTLISVLHGQGKLQVGSTTYELKRGDHLLLTAKASAWTLSGDMDIIASVPGKQAQ